MAATVESATQTLEMDSDEDLDLLEIPMASPRVVIDTSPPIGSVEEAVMRFGGRGFWIPRHLLPDDHVTTQLLPPFHNPHDPEEPDIYKLKDRTAAMLKDLQMKEQETFDILKELESTKRLVEELKLKLPKEPLGSINHHATKPEELSNPLPMSTADVIMMELKETKLNIYQNTSELAAIRTSVESLSKKMEREPRPNMPVPVRNDSINPMLISRELRELNYEAEQFMKTAEAARSEVFQAMSEVEQTKTGLKVIEMRWVAAKKLEEAARATESLALAEIRAFSSNDSVNQQFHTNNIKDSQKKYPGQISLSLEEYSALTDKARKAENLFKRKIEEATDERLSKMALEEVLGRVEAMNRRKVSFDPTQRNSFQSRPRRDSRLLNANEFESMKNESKPVVRPMKSIGDILSRKLVLRDDSSVGRQVEGGGVERQRVSLNQMLRQQRGETETSPLNRREKDGVESKKFFSKRKALGFVHISLPLSRPSKNKIQPPIDGF